jgi:hypothetical protein
MGHLAALIDTCLPSSPGPFSLMEKGRQGPFTLLFTPLALREWGWG